MLPNVSLQLLRPNMQIADAAYRDSRDSALMSRRSGRLDIRIGTRSGTVRNGWRRHTRRSSWWRLWRTRYRWLWWTWRLWCSGSTRTVGSNSCSMSSTLDMFSHLRRRNIPVAWSTMLNIVAQGTSLSKAYATAKHLRTWLWRHDCKEGSGSMLSG